MYILGIYVPQELLQLYVALVVCLIAGIASCFTHLGSRHSIGLMAISITLLLATAAGHIVWAATLNPWYGVDTGVAVVMGVFVIFE